MLTSMPYQHREHPPAWRHQLTTIVSLPIREQIVVIDGGGGGGGDRDGDRGGESDGDRDGNGDGNG